MCKPQPQITSPDLANPDLDGNDVISPVELLNACILSAKMFFSVDRDQDGALDKDELRETVERILGADEAEAALNSIFREMDSDESGRIEVRELRKAGSRLRSMKNLSI